MFLLSSLFLLNANVDAADNGMAITPPMGWRSWNLYGKNVNQQLMISVMDGMVRRDRLVDGKNTSLCDLGYCDVGLDDNWQACGQGSGTNFHDANGNPIVNTQLFPDMKSMTDHAHSLGLTAGWYGNNCICSERNTSDIKYYKGDVNALIQYGYDSVKLDGCGVQTDLQQYYELFNATGKAITIENCHWGSKVPFEPNATWCPWNFYRTSGDIRANYPRMLSNLQTVTKYAEKGLSKPGCWAYPDMLEVGCSDGPGGSGDPGLNPEETRAHFGAWCIVSSPLTLSHDVNNATTMDAIWPVIANPEAIAVNQAWAGHSGSPFVTVSGDHQFYYKPVDSTHTAILLMNQGATTQDLTFNFADVPGLSCTSCNVRDIWERTDIGSFTSSFTASAVPSHDAAFLMISS
jgi:alpha-galactosidase